MRRRFLVLSGLGLATGLGVVTAVQPVTVLNAVARVGSRRRAEGLAYGGLPRQRFDLFLPDPRPAEPPPLVLFFYGGAWNRGQREDYRFVGEALAECGLAALVADYRLYPQVRYPGFVQDSAAAAMHALRQAAVWGADPRRVVLAGHSAGAYNVAMLALDPRWLAAAGGRPEQFAGWAGLAGPYDFLPIRAPDVQAAFGHPDVPPDSQPLVHARQSRLPCLLAAPEQDDRVDPQRNTVALARALRATGTPVTEHRYARVGHETLVGAFARPLRPLAPVLDDLAAFVHALEPARGR